MEYDLHQATVSIDTSAKLRFRYIVWGTEDAIYDACWSWSSNGWKLIMVPFKQASQEILNISEGISPSLEQELG